MNLKNMSHLLPKEHQQIFTMYWTDEYKKPGTDGTTVVINTEPVGNLYARAVKSVIAFVDEDSPAE